MRNVKLLGFGFDSSSKPILLIMDADADWGRFDFCFLYHWKDLLISKQLSLVRKKEDTQNASQLACKVDKMQIRVIDENLHNCILHQSVALGLAVILHMLSMLLGYYMNIERIFNNSADLEKLVSILSSDNN